MQNRVLILFIGVITVFSCAKPSVLLSSEKMLSGGYDQYKTYAFLPTTDTNYAKMINRSVLVPAMVAEAKAQLEKKGMTLDTAHPDCLFTYHLVLNRKYDVNQQKEVVYNQQVYNAASVPMYNTSGAAVSGRTYTRAGTAPGSDIYYFSSDNRPYTFNGQIMIDTLREGSMVIDMIDTKTKKVIWRSVAEGTRRESETLPPEEAARVMIPAMLKKLPRK